MAKTPHGDRLEAFAASFVKEHRLPGAAVGVVEGGELVWSTGVGGAVARFQAIESVTIRRLLSHESGLLSEPPGTDWSIPRCFEGDVARTLARAGEIGTVMPPNRQWKYSNLAYQLLGEIVARVSGSPYTDYVSEKILQPLAMSATSFEPLPGQLAARVATGYAGRSFSDELEVAPAMPPISAEGGLWSCVEDLSNWVGLQLGAYRDAAGEKDATGALVLSAGDLKEMHKLRYIVDDEWTSAWGISSRRSRSQTRRTPSWSSPGSGSPASP